MKSAMVFPNLESESAISNYTLNIIESLSNNNFKINKETYSAGKPFTLFKKFKNLKNYDLIHIQHEYNLLGNYGSPFFLLFPYLKLFNKGRLVTTLHTVLSQKEKFKGSRIKTFLRKILYLTQNIVINWASDKVIVHCHYFKNILIKEYGFKEKKIAVIPQAIIEGIKTSSKEEAKKELKLSGNVYLVIGSFVPDHGADVVISQADKIGKTILIATNPNSSNDRNNQRILNYLEYNKKIVKEKNLDNIVRFDLGKIPFELWWKYFSAADLILLPYRGGIGSGIFSDAIAMKVPMVGGDIPYFQEFSKKYGIIEVAKNDNFPAAIKKIMKPENYKIMKKKFDKYIDEFGISSIGKKYKKIYQSI